jgi:hypothetical protein
MFILKRQDVEIYNIQHPKKDQQVPILRYQGQTFRLISVFHATQKEDARSLWRNLTDNRGKACVLLEEPERYSIWGKVRLEQPDASISDEQKRESEKTERKTEQENLPCHVQAYLLLLQAMYIDIEDLLGTRQSAAFRKELVVVFQQQHLLQPNAAKSVDQLLQVNPLTLVQIPDWQTSQIDLLLQQLYRLGKQHFGNPNFVERTMQALQDLPLKERILFLNWLKQTAAGKFWQ